MKKTILILSLLFLLPASALAADQSEERPHWSLELKGGIFTPALPGFKEFYGSKSTDEFGGTLAYKIIRQVELGIEGEYVRAGGQGFAPLHGFTAGHVTYELFPLNVFALVRGVFSENQVVVPYAGGGFTRMYYDEKVDLQGSVRGHADGYHGRAGLQFLLDGLDSSAANSFYLDYGVFHTYFFIEAEYSRVMANTVSGGSVNLGGTSYLAGLLFEF